jgi:hypothetical protein
MEKKWYEVDWSEELCIIAIVIIAISGANNPVVAALGGGLIGYLTRSFKGG